MAMPHGRSTGREGFSPRDYLRALGTTFAYTPRVMAMVRRTSPGLTAGVAGVTVVRALVPAATIWLTKLVIDAVVSRGGGGRLVVAGGSRARPANRTA